MDDLTLDEAMEDLESAEDFLNFFGIAFDQKVVHVNRLHILQRFHNYIAKTGLPTADEGARRAAYAAMLARAYEDFVQSDALTEKVFKVFHMHEPQTAFVPLTSIGVSKREPAHEHGSGDCGCGGQGMCHSVEGALRS
ncbi:MAG: nitrogen fixation protein NifW [Thiobacillus sp.]|nr:nitrogen fixation protein NifW [Thiobacillus sp.]